MTITADETIFLTQHTNAVIKALKPRLTGYLSWTLPVNTVAPAVTGTGTVGQTLTCSPGTWTTGTSGTNYQWQRNGVAISGAQNSTYVLVGADSGTSVRCVVTVINSFGRASANSNAVAVA
jgi:hypothetical protein